MNWNICSISTFHLHQQCLSQTILKYLPKIDWYGQQWRNWAWSHHTNHVMREEIPYLTDWCAFRKYIWNRDFFCVYLMKWSLYYQIKMSRITYGDEVCRYRFNFRVVCFSSSLIEGWDPLLWWMGTFYHTERLETLEGRPSLVTMSCQTASPPSYIKFLHIIHTQIYLQIISNHIKTKPYLPSDKEIRVQCQCLASDLLLKPSYMHNFLFLCSWFWQYQRSELRAFLHQRDLSENLLHFWQNL